MSSLQTQLFKDALFAAQKFLEEGRTGQATSDVSQILTFISIVLRNHLDDQIEQQIRNIVTNKTYVAAMSKGLITKVGGNTIPGEFYRIPGVKITVKLSGSESSIGINELLKAISEHGRRASSKAKSLDINSYIISTLSQMFTTFITQFGPSIGMEKRDRDAIVSATVIEPVQTPYHQTQRMTAIKALINKGLELPAVREALGNIVGPSTVQFVGQAVDGFDGSTASKIQESFAKALATQDITPIFETATGVYTDIAGNFSTDDGVKAYDQE
jgi:hypothetical protein